MMMSVVGRILGSSVERSSSGVVGVASWKIRPPTNHAEATLLLSLRGERCAARRDSKLLGEG
jgi:hypothetical protein